MWWETGGQSVSEGCALGGVRVKDCGRRVTCDSETLAECPATFDLVFAGEGSLRKNIRGIPGLLRPDELRRANHADEAGDARAGRGRGRDGDVEAAAAEFRDEDDFSERSGDQCGQRRMVGSLDVGVNGVDVGISGEDRAVVGCAENLDRCGRKGLPESCEKGEGADEVADVVLPDDEDLLGRRIQSGTDGV